jgi:hypothetical protein
VILRTRTATPPGQTRRMLRTGRFVRRTGGAGIAVLLLLALGPVAPDTDGAQHAVRIPLPGPVLAVSGEHAIVGDAR